MKAPITSAQAMSHPTVVETINVLSESCRELRAELETARADEREACCVIVYGQCESDNVAQRTVDAIRARGTT